jgi:serine protease Do
MPFDPLNLHRFSARLFDRTLPIRLMPAAALAAALCLTAAQPAAARGPENIADVAEQVIDAVVNISTSQKVDPRVTEMPDLPPGSPMEEFFDQFFKNRRGGGGNEQTPRRINSLGSGFIIDASGLVVTNNHVIADADEINVILNDGTKLKATLVGKDNKSDLALLRVHSDKPIKAVKFGDSDKLRLGEWVIAIGNPFSLGGSVTAGIVSARNRDINSGPYDNYIQTDAAINRGNSGGPLFNLNGEVVGVNTAIISPSGGSIGIGFAVPSNSAVAVIDQLRQFGETRRGWLGVRIQQVTDDIAESLAMSWCRSTAMTSRKCTTCRVSSPTRRSARSWMWSSFARASRRRTKSRSAGCRTTRRSPKPASSRKRRPINRWCRKRSVSNSPNCPTTSAASSRSRAR